MIDLKASLELIHICASHRSGEMRRAAVSEFLSKHPEIDKKELLNMMPDIPVS